MSRDLPSNGPQAPGPQAPGPQAPGPQADGPLAEPELFLRIPPSFPEAAVFRRLGRRRTTRIPPRQEDAVRQTMEETADQIQLQGALLRLPVSWPGPETVQLPGGETIRSRQLARFLDGCREILLLGATAGPAPAEEIQRLTEAGQLDRAGVVDAAAGEMVDSALSWLQARKGRELLREGWTVDQRRFSPGYGDLPLEVQALFFRLLSMERLGVGLTESHLMIPEKSVLAVTALRQGEKQE